MTLKSPPDEHMGATNLQPKAEPMPLYGHSRVASMRLILSVCSVSIMPPSRPPFRTSTHRLAPPPAPPPAFPIPGDELMHMNGCPLIDSLCHSPCLVICH
ncbi:hypothetical protein ILYODFUR_020931 [Ilyodon furcidens]|uniref:Uncharacterized protein n=1 Tax=Ilyodon furcidens TaxID=33524 RepID=A0ABV0TCS6_9TELE